MAALKNGHIPQLLATEYSSFRDQVISALARELVAAERARSRPLVIYDPMAGTAPLIALAEQHGYTAYFNDLNTLHLHVNAAKTFRSYQTFKRIGPARLLSTALRMAPKLDRYPRTATDEWIEPPILKELIFAWERSKKQNEQICVLTRAILLLSIRSFASFIKTKNPTWIKPGGLRQKISIDEAFGSAIDRLRGFYHRVYERCSVISGGRVILTDYDATQRTPRRRVDLIVTSPPFCNRVDWDRLYAPEHYFLSAVGALQAKGEFLGTTAVEDYTAFESDMELLNRRSGYVTHFLQEVRKRQVGGERRSDYYVKYFTRYFAGLLRIFGRIADILGEENAGIYFVVQDNVHRGLLIQIHRALSDFLAGEGFYVCPLNDSWDRHHLGLQNVSRRYRLVSPKQQESIWHALR